MKVNTAFAEAFVNAAAKDLLCQKQVDHQRWVARAVADKVLNTDAGTKHVPSVVVHSARGTMVRG